MSRRSLEGEDQGGAKKLPEGSILDQVATQMQKQVFILVHKPANGDWYLLIIAASLVNLSSGLLTRHKLGCTSTENC